MVWEFLRHHEVPVRVSGPLLALTLLAPAAAAQSPATARRGGAYISAGVSYGSYLVSSNYFGNPGNAAYSQSQRASGFAWSFQIGGTLDPNWRFGAQMNNYTSSFSADTAVLIVFYTAAATFYPSETKSLWIRGNLGFGSLRLTNGSEGGIAGGLAVGYEWYPFSPEFAITPWASYMAQFTDKTMSGNVGTSGGSARVQFLEVGVGFGLRH